MFYNNKFKFLNKTQRLIIKVSLGLINLLVKPVEWYYNNRRMTKLINSRIKEWNNYKIKARDENSSY